MKKRKAIVIPILLALVLCMGVFFPAFAESGSVNNDYDYIFDVYTYEDLEEWYRFVHENEGYNHSFLIKLYDDIQLEYSMSVFATDKLKFEGVDREVTIYSPTWDYGAHSSEYHFHLDVNDLSLIFENVILAREPGTLGGGIMVEQSNITIDGANLSGCINGIHSIRTDLTIQDTTITGPSYDTDEISYGIVLENNHNTNLYNVRIEGCTQGIYAIDSMGTNIADSEISNNNSNQYGAGIYAESTDMELYNVTMTGNQSQKGGAIYVGGENTSFIARYITLENNEALEDGGGIYYNSDFHCHVYDSKIQYNIAAKHGGGIFAGIGSDLDCIEVVFKSNQALVGPDIYYEGYIEDSTYVNDDDSYINYSGSWVYDTGEGFYNNDNHYSADTGAYAELYFEGTGVEWIGATNDNLGIANVYVDGQLVDTVDQYSPQLEVQKVLYSAQGLDDGIHSIRIEVSGNKNAVANGYYATVDAFAVVGEPTTKPESPIVNDNDPSITYSGSWVYATGNDFYYGDNHYSNQIGAYAQLQFEGTGIQWIGATNDNLGIANIYIDGVLVDSVDQYGPTLETQKVLYTAQGLPNGTHTIRIEINGEKNPAAADAYTTVDAFQIIR